MTARAKLPVAAEARAGVPDPFGRHLVEGQERDRDIGHPVLDGPERGFDVCTGDEVRGSPNVGLGLRLARRPLCTAALPVALRGNATF